MKKLRLSFCAAILLFTASCNFNTSVSNREADIQEAEKFGAQFYRILKEGDFEKAYPLFSKDFYRVVDTPGLNRMLTATASKLGEIKSIYVVDCQTLIVKGTDSRSEYTILYRVERSKNASEEIIKMGKENNKIKIMAYKVNSDGFLESKK